MTRQVLVLYNDNMRRKALGWIVKAPKETRIEFKGPKRTLPQNDLMWLRLSEVSQQMIWYDEYLSADDWKDMFTASLRKCRVVPGIDAGTSVPLGMRTSDMSKSEMSDLLELIAAFAASHGLELSA
jgi:hypothetical protein